MVLYQCSTCGHVNDATAWNEATQAACHGSIVPLEERVGDCWFICPFCGHTSSDLTIRRVVDQKYDKNFLSMLEKIKASSSIPCPLTYGLVKECGDATCKECWITLLKSYIQYKQFQRGCSYERLYALDI